MLTTISNPDPARGGKSMVEKFTLLDFDEVSSAYEDQEHRSVCGSCGSYYCVSPSELKETKTLCQAMYEALKGVLRTFEAHNIKTVDPRYLKITNILAKIERK